MKKGRVMRNWIYEAPETKIELAKPIEPSPAPFAGAFAEAERKRMRELDGVSPRDWAMASEALSLTNAASELDRLAEVAHAVAKARKEGVETGQALAAVAMMGQSAPGWPMPPDAVPVDCAGNPVGPPPNDWIGVPPIGSDKPGSSPEPDAETFEKNVFDPKNWGL